MPIYEYECLACQDRFAAFARLSDPPPEKCLKCGGELERIISLTNAGEVQMDARELYKRRIHPEAKAIADKIKSGDQDAAADFFGEKALNNSE
jgi:putative FmdB family regulatory protein